MNQDEFRNSIKEQAIKLIDEILAKKNCRLDNLRKLVQLRHALQLEEDSLFLPIIGIISETDEFPSGDIRSKFNSKALEQYDKELDEYLQISSDVIERTCIRLKTKLETLSINSNIQ